jgi:hypothetical protein
VSGVRAGIWLEGCGFTVECTAVILPYWYSILRRWRGNGAVGLRGGFEREEMLRWNTIQYSTIQYSKKCIVS